MLLFAGVVVLSCSVGKADLEWNTLADSGSMAYRILTEVRLPRVLLGFLAGGILALSGLLFQTLFRNPLTTPFTLGISGGATLGVSIAILAGWGSLGVAGVSLLTLFGFAGALGSLGLIYLISRHLGSGRDNRLILAGIALSYLYAALLMLFYYLSDFEESFMITRYTMGSLLTVGYLDLGIVASGALLLLWVAYYYRNALRYLSVSYAFAFLRGVEVARVMLLLFVLISLAVGILVSVTGPIGFIGLIIPHMVRLFLKRPVDGLLWPTFFFGGIFLVLCDTVARAVPSASSVPVGVVTSFIGGGLFIWILLKR